MLLLPMDQPILHSLMNDYSELGFLQRGQPDYAKELVKYIFPAEIYLAIRSFSRMLFQSRENDGAKKQQSLC